MPQIFANRVFNKKGPPIHLIWFITAKCNLKCCHCFYHEQISGNAKNELGFDEFEKVISKLKPLLSVSLTGGEPFLRQDLPEIASLFAKKRLTNNITLFTNGFDTNHIVAATEKILYNCPGIKIGMGISIDGYEKEHDEYRNKQGSYSKAVNTVRMLKKLKNNFPNLSIGIGITLHKGNQQIIRKLREDLYYELGIIPGITLIRGDARSPDLKNVDAGIYKETIMAIEKDRVHFKNKNIFQALVSAREVLGQKLAYTTYIKNSRSYDCYAGSLMGIIYENGDMYPCEMLKDCKLGNLRDYDYDVNKLWKSEKADEVRNWIKSRKCFCTYECQYTCNTLYDIKFMPFFIWNVLKYIKG